MKRQYSDYRDDSIVNLIPGKLYEISDHNNFAVLFFPLGWKSKMAYDSIERPFIAMYVGPYNLDGITYRKILWKNKIGFTCEQTYNKLL